VPRAGLPPFVVARNVSPGIKLRPTQRCLREQSECARIRRVHGQRARGSPAYYVSGSTLRVSKHAVRAYGFARHAVALTVKRGNPNGRQRALASVPHPLEPVGAASNCGWCSPMHIMPALADMPE